MAAGRQSEKKGRSRITPTPATGLFQPRPFAAPTEPQPAMTPEVQTLASPTALGSDRLSRIEVSPPSAIQPKLAIGAPGDKYEREADRLAQQVVEHINSPTPPEPNPGNGSLQRQTNSQPSIAKLTAQPPQTTATGETSSHAASSRAFPTRKSIFLKSEQSHASDSSGMRLQTRKPTPMVQQSSPAIVQTKLTRDQIKHANRIRKVRGFALLPLDEQPQQVNPPDEQPQQVNDPQPHNAPQSDARREGSQFQVASDYSWIRSILKQFKSWDNVKAQFGSDRDTMWQFFDFRQWYVDSLISVLRDTYPGLIAKSVGSQDPTSDYDITICTPQSGNDVEAIQWFNAQVRKEFGVEPGTLFDTNLYAKDYLKVKENVDPSGENQPNADTDLDQPTGGFGIMGSLSQDVAALVKQRRYMKPVEWERYVDEVVDSISDPQEKQIILKQYEEADAIYQLSAYELLQEIENSVNPEQQQNIYAHITLGPEEEQVLEEVENPNLRNEIRQQLLGAERLQYFTETESDLVLQKSNKLYLERMTKVRHLQATIQALGDGDPERVETLKAQVKQILGEACFFAAEAYHSEGAVKHIVAGVQGAKNPEQKDAIMQSLAPEHFLQSFNEQLGDFLKDFHHYGGEHPDENHPPGKLFYRASKYLHRLFLAVEELRQYKFNDLERLEIETQRGNVEQIGNRIKNELVAIRKGDRTFETEADKNQAAVEAMQNILGVSEPLELKQKILKMAQEFNAKVRNRITQSLSLDTQTSRNYFQHIE
ncbi:hypothetical protein [Phormidium sp. CCY1219]|uniref:hypothetical protein n=1 Tax=Phormidium sp. CCY1219 TaxID=2886104 RepID=UPI002D1F42CD|nr:hypothetical protein [Phormidium sp. CCY1219]MEB3828431.1 hypothetical protein [Phormidium sp. CCY1219]